MATKYDPKDSLRNKWAKVHAHKAIISTWNKQIEAYNEKIKLGFKQPTSMDGMVLTLLREEEIPLELPPPEFWSSPIKKFGSSALTALTVCIVGAGTAGLFTGMIFDYIKSNVKDFNVTYQILEAAEAGPFPQPFSPVQRAGRLFSCSWETGHTTTPRSYFDVGSMRYPQNPVMQRTFDLFGTLRMELQALTKTTPAGALVPYYMNNVENPSQPPPANAVIQEWWRFNDITEFGDLNVLSKSVAGNDVFSLNTHGQIPAECLLNTSYFESLIRDLKSDLKTQAWETAWRTLMQCDKQSTRTYLEQTHGCTFETIQYLEMLNGGSGYYDQALSETVLESIDFDYDPAPNTTIPWWRIVGGSAQLARNMTNNLEVRPQYGQRVTRIDWNDYLNTSVYTNDSLNPTTYAAVFNSTTMGCLRMMNTLKAGFSSEVKEAMRTLSYGASAKVGVVFSEPWWMSNATAHPILSGGQGHSDLIIRTCVYPSYSLNTQSRKHVLLCSYTWQQDATRISSMMCGTNNNNLDHATVVANEANLKERILRDLAHLHTTTPAAADALYEVINGLYLDHYSHDWTNDPNSAGAFAFFGPDQFSRLWPKIIAPTNDIIIIGEHASPHHAWVVGALESALVGVYQWLNQYARSGLITGVEDALKLLAGTEEGNPFVGLPGYYSPETADWHALSALVQKELILMERDSAKEGKSSLKP